MRGPTMTAAWLAGHLVLETPETIDAAYARVADGSALLALGLHLGPVEMPAIYSAVRSGRRVAGPMEIIDNPPLQAWYVALRERLGVQAVTPPETAGPVAAPRAARGRPGRHRGRPRHRRQRPPDAAVRLAGPAVRRPRRCWRWRAACPRTRWPSGASGGAATRAAWSRWTCRRMARCASAWRPSWRARRGPSSASWPPPRSNGGPSCSPSGPISRSRPRPRR